MVDDEWKVWEAKPERKATAIYGEMISNQIQLMKVNMNFCEIK